MALSKGFKFIPGYPGYFISPDLDLYSIRQSKLKKKKCHIDKQGYIKAPIGGHDSIYLHKLILLAFKGEPLFNNHQTRHLDDNKLNNHPQNLEWGTNKENTEDAKRNKRLMFGMKCHKAKLNDNKVKEIKMLRGKLSAPKIAQKFGIYKSTVYKIWSRLIWKHIT